MKSGSQFTDCPECGQQCYWDYHTDQWRHDESDLPLGQCDPPEPTFDWTDDDEQAFMEHDELEAGFVPMRNYG